MNIKEQVLSKEQMAYLRKLGIDTSDASMYWYHENSCGDRYWTLLPYDKDYGIDEETIATYTIGDLFNKLPHFIGKYEFILEYRDLRNMGGDIITSIGYVYTDCELNNNWLIHLYESNIPLKDMLYNLLCWFIENYINPIEAER